MKTRLVTYAAAVLLSLASVCAIQPTFAADAGTPGTHAKPENIPHVETGRAVPIPQYQQDGGPWATPRPTSMTAFPPRVSFGFCRSGPSDMFATCLGLNQLLRLLRFGA